MTAKLPFRVGSLITAWSSFAGKPVYHAIVFRVENTQVRLFSSDSGSIVRPLATVVARFDDPPELYPWKVEVF